MKQSKYFCYYLLFYEKLVSSARLSCINGCCGEQVIHSLVDYICVWLCVVTVP